ncbi:MAG: carboxylating nicotinate-nucleotide diphosphorylase [Gammaproteobacteria bacterium]|nr:carboxylating nicotinate-nucleotide diphosphorylase [Gammaproteobacteria bacterium]
MSSLPLPADLQRVVQTALAEDVGSGDITAALIPPQTQSRAHIISREDAVLCGTAWVDEVFRQLDQQIRIDWQARDGDAIVADQVLCILSGNARQLLTGERTALNFLQTLSATATQTRQFVRAIDDTDTRVLDTRKTLPGLRSAQKYAVRCGGGHNHRFGLFDAFLIKENHILAVGSIGAAVQSARAQQPGTKVEVEVENLEELQQALDAGVDQILLDNMNLPRLREAVALNNGQTLLEASGGVSLETIRDIAHTGVDYISIGSLSKDIRAIDLSMRLLD